MFYFFLAVLCGFLTALTDVLCKIYMDKTGKDAFFTLFLRWALAIPFLVPFVFSKEKSFEPHFLLIYALGIPLEILSAYLYMRAIELADVSLVLPFQALTPVLLPITSGLILGEKYPPEGILGIIMVSAGSVFMLRTSGGKPENKGEGKNLKKENTQNKKTFVAVLLMVGSATIYSITSVFGRYMSQKLDPEFFGSTYMMTLTAGMAPIFLRKYGIIGLKETLFSISPLKFSIGLSMGGVILSHFFALSGLETAYMISLKRTSVLFSVLLGYLMLKEGSFKERMLGASFMFAGVVIIAFSIG